ncbi:MAG: xanthine dehydrogenase family protein molybdopterin-binding subunit [Alphaproteobacteria bacterium]|nr:xanthine dehydrogenase family protein molybdopterin-binding subunit [Alphaproteobacteria bacterium]
MGMRYFGTSVQRQEDKKFLMGQGRYVDDIEFVGMLHGAFLRADIAHAKINGIDTSAAREIPGVHAVYTLDDLGDPYPNKPMTTAYASPLLKQTICQHLLAKDEVCFVGQTVALVVAESRHIAEDALSRIVVDYEPLPAVADCRNALDADAPATHLGLDSNLVGNFYGKFGDIDAAFAEASHTFKVDFHEHRGGGHATECRNIIANYDAGKDETTVYLTTQAPFLIRRLMARYFEEDESKIRVICPDVGGGFGPKNGPYAEEFVLAIVSKQLQRPVKWIEDRRENFVATNQQGDQMWHMEIACEDDGKILGARGRVIHDMGAYVPYGLLLPATSVFPLPGPYALPALDVTLDAVFTNKTCTSPVRGAGRPNAAYAMERLIETVARGLKLDPADVRRRNFVRKDQFPYTTGGTLPSGDPAVYDSGDFHSLLDMALENAGYEDFKERQAAARQEGRYLGMGISSCIEDTGFGPYEGVKVKVQPSGKVLLQTGAASQGQGHQTVFSQIVAEELGVDIDSIVYQSADTGTVPHGVATAGSRVTANAGPASQAAARLVRKKALKLAAEVLEIDEDDLEIEDGIVRATAQSGRNVNISLGDLSFKLTPLMNGKVPDGFEPELEATSFTSSTGVPHASGSSVAEVEVDVETGEVKLVNYVIAHDCGKMINPMLVDGQIIGGVVHGIGNALFERMVYDENAQPMSMNYGEYLLPIATEMPPFEVLHQETPSPHNELGVKGAGEGGTIPAANAIIAAIENALEPFGVVVNDHPVDPQRICELLDEAQARSGAA